jgi:peptidoglycan/xylan/chitin deacetylase (PgdA/CDA1 family)
MAAKQIPILMYHSIDDGCSPQFRRFAVSPATFETHVRYLCEHGYQALTVSGLLGALDGRSALPEKPVVLTFDDGFADFYDAALPILLEFGQTATFYVVSGAVGGSSAWLSGIGEGARRTVSWSQLDEIRRSGIEIGAHSVTHAALDLLPLDKAREEIAIAKRDLENRLGCEVASFAYPFGYQNAGIRGLVQREGYSSACAVRYATSSPTDDRFALSRHIALDSWDSEALGAVLAGRPRLISNLYDQTRSRAWRAVRQAVWSLYQ